MSEKTQLEEQEAIVTFSQNSWDGQRIEGSSAVNALEQGKVLFFPHLAFPLSAQQQRLLDPALVDPKKKNISYSVGNHLIKGVADAAVEPQIRKLLESYYQSCSALISSVLPQYQHVLRKPVNSLRLHPVTVWRNNSSWRKDDSRLHVDAFPFRPNYGERILRIFTNVNPHGEDRVWRVGEPFSELATRMLPKLSSYSPRKSWLLEKIGVTKSLRSHYDHLMLQLHDKMKADGHYQQHGQQLTQRFPTGSTWVCFSDQTPHAAMSGQFMLEQTFLMSVKDMQNPELSPLKTLQRLTRQKLI
ncbi:3-deoxy-D-manno-oct-2-ulosonic acid (Kdo) hydroxylase [Rouxiella silvae]|uniref:3-deoxy-D-manno-oct-2-ulosonic acid (Kdo) hydroxylase n=1 Tax=Rouxiella silvae TaxID=1646373 RepID=A0AA40X4I2_9GAMM|nr:Kdo hydroxylase family protein [Rouxiella silvae]MBF6638538.1 Kdo hydroxylase family protein [Rouxiella silvae]ORJ20238.1 3-deoxy-D-manno-oct-2-ulosonic acid (Kdo) hydroxylase [Rouxiella silvae]